MAKEEKDMSNLDWKNIQEPVASSDSSEGVSAKKRQPKRFREIPEYYFLPRRSLSYNLCFYGACIAGGIGAGMLIETWINKKVKGNGSSSSLSMLFKIVWTAKRSLELMKSQQVELFSLPVFVDLVA